jgi:hypothetical protein
VNELGRTTGVRFTGGENISFFAESRLWCSPSLAFSGSQGQGGHSILRLKYAWSYTYTTGVTALRSIKQSDVISICTVLSYTLLNVDSLLYVAPRRQLERFPWQARRTYVAVIRLYATAQNAELCTDPCKVEVRVDTGFLRCHPHFNPWTVQDLWTKWRWRRFFIPIW